MTPLVFTCEAASLAGVVHPAGGETGVLIVAGGAQTRVGAHGMFAALGAGLAARGIPVFRFDRRGIGDSDGDDAGFEGAAADIAAAANAFRAACPAVRRIVGVGHCDGAAALALAHDGIDALVLINPWTIDGDAPPPSAVVAAHYRRRLRQSASWRRLLSGGVDIRGALRSLFGAARPPRLSSLAERLATALSAGGKPLLFVLSERDAAAQAARALASRFGEARSIAGADHSFSDPHDLASARQAIFDFIARNW